MITRLRRSTRRRTAAGATTALLGCLAVTAATSDDKTGWSTTPGDYPVFVGADSATPQPAGAITAS